MPNDLKFLFSFYFVEKFVYFVQVKSNPQLAAMGILSKFITGLLSRRERYKPQIEFGKYTERFDQPDYTQKLEQAKDLYNKGKILEAYAQVFDFLTDPSQQNLTYHLTPQKIDFEFFQGSKKVQGTINNSNIYAEAPVASFEQTLPLALSELLLQENNKLRYCKFSVQDNNLILKYDSPVAVANPEVLYHALRELAINADSYDDILVERYKDLKPVNIQHITQLSEQEIKVKIEFIRRWIKQTLSLVEKLNKDKLNSEANQGLVSYLLLALIYKIFYLIAPEGVLLDLLKQLDSAFWSENQNLMQKNNYLILSFEQLQKQPDSYFRKSLYKVKSTFSIVPPIKDEKIAEFVSTELEKINWIKSKHPDLYVLVSQFIIGYLNFHIALKPFHQKLLNILWRVTNDDYFLALGYSLNFISRNRLNSFAIEFQINKLLGQYKVKSFRVSKLDYSSTADFVKTFLSELVNACRNE